MSTIDIKITITGSDTPDATPAETGSWQPIETSPRTTKSRLVWCPENQMTYLVSWSNGTGRFHHLGGSYTLDETPTHWMWPPVGPVTP